MVVLTTQLKVSIHDAMYIDVHVCNVYIESIAKSSVAQLVRALDLCLRIQLVFSSRVHMSLPNGQG